MGTSSSWILFSIDLPSSLVPFSAPLGGAAAWPIAARAQQGEARRRIGVFGAVLANRVMGAAYQAFLDELANFLGCVIRGEPCHPGLREGALSLEVALAQLGSQRDGLQRNIEGRMP